jgi:DNA repair protein RecN (Recombination protein N)
LRELGLPGGEVRLRRELDRSGRGRAFLNGSLTLAATLARIGDALVDFHGQHEHQSLLRPAIQLDLLDAYGRLEAPRTEVAAAYSRWNELEGLLEASRMSQEERLRALDLYRFQAREIDAASPREGEEEELEAELPRLKDAEKLRALGTEAAAHLSDSDGAAVSTIARAERLLDDLTRLDPGLQDAREALLQGRLAVEEAARSVADYCSKLEADPERLEEVLTRQEALSRLRRKYGATLTEVLAYRQRIGSEIERLDHFEEHREDLESRLAEAEKAFDRLSLKVHKARMEAARKLASAIAGRLKNLGMPGVRFSISVEMEEGRRGPAGSDSVEFLIAPNPGEPLKPLKSVASGGELSRTMLGLKTVLAAQDRIPVLVFDEVDAGVGGAVAHAVGGNLSALARSRQVLCVTHLPQVASYAEGHVAVTKEVVRGRTVARVETLQTEERRQEIARMLSGRGLTPTSLKAAEELLASSSTQAQPARVRQ